MFESARDQLPAWVYFLIQAVLIWPLIIFTEAIPVLLAVLGLDFLPRMLDRLNEIGTATVFAFIGVAFALAAAKLWPQLPESGKWVWTVPALLFMLGAVLTFAACPTQPCSNGQPSLTTYLDDWFRTGGSEGVGLVLITYPSYSIAAYSLAMLVIARRTTPQTAGQ